MFSERYGSKTFLGAGEVLGVLRTYLYNVYEHSCNVEIFLVLLTLILSVTV